MIIGNTTEEFTLLAACDSVYLKNFAKGFVTSCALAGNNSHIHVTNPTEEDKEYVNYLNEGYKRLNIINKMTFSYDYLDISNYTSKEKITFYACNRFIVAPEVVKGDILILDIDSVIMKYVPNFQYDVMLYFSNNPKHKMYHDKVWGNYAKRVMAGAVYCSYQHINYLVKVKDFILNNRMAWYLDQVALVKTYKTYKDKNIGRFADEFLDMKFREDSYIWSSKGKSKYFKVYQNKLKDLDLKFSMVN